MSIGVPRGGDPSEAPAEGSRVGVRELGFISDVPKANTHGTSDAITAVKLFNGPFASFTF